MLLKNGKVFVEGAFKALDILSSDGKIIKLEKNIQDSENTCGEVIDIKGKHVLPGAIDVHTHLDLDLGIVKSNDDFYTGTVAAACGGTTAIVDHIGFGPKGCKLSHQIDVYHQKADGNAVIDYGFHGVIQHVDNDVLAMMEKLVDRGITSYKVYMTYDGKLSDGDIMKVFSTAKDLGILVAIHAENDGVIAELKSLFTSAGFKSPEYHPLSRPELCEAEAVNRMLCLGQMIGDVPLYFVHISNIHSLDYIDYFKNMGYEKVFVETCPQYLFLDDSLYQRKDGIKYILSPPLRDADNNNALFEAIGENEIDVIATDHCPFSYHGDKQLGKDDFTKCPNGMPGVELRYPLMISSAIQEKLSFERLVETCCKNPAKLFGLKNKGEIKNGYDCDLVILDLEISKTIKHKDLHENVDYTPYEGMTVYGRIEKVLSHGKIIVIDNAFVGKKGDGTFIKREKYSFE
jgi:dihydropyrimidinase